MRFGNQYDSMVNLLDSEKSWKPYTKTLDNGLNDDVGMQKPLIAVQQASSDSRAALASTHHFLKEQVDSDEKLGQRISAISVSLHHHTSGHDRLNPIVSSSNDFRKPLLAPFEKMEASQKTVPLESDPCQAQTHQNIPGSVTGPTEYRRLSIKDLNNPLLEQPVGERREWARREKALESTLPPSPSLPNISSSRSEPMEVDFPDNVQRRHFEVTSDLHNQPPWAASEPSVTKEHLRHNQVPSPLTREPDGSYSTPSSPPHSPLRRPRDIIQPPSLDGPSEIESNRHMKFMQSPASPYPHPSPDLLGNNRILPDRRRSILMDEAMGGSHSLGRRSSMPLVPMRHCSDVNNISEAKHNPTDAPGHYEFEFYSSNEYHSGSGGEGSSGRRGSMYSRSPELRLSHKLAERKRRKEMKELFDELRDSMPTRGNLKTSKWEILSKAVDYITYLKQRDQELEKEIGSLRHELIMMKHSRDA